MSLYHILYENEILFRLEEPATFIAAEVMQQSPKPVVQEKSPAQPSHAPELPVIEPPLPQKEAVQVPFPEVAHPLLILTEAAGQPNLTVSEATLLSNILKAVGHSITEAEVINYSYLINKDARVVLADKKVNHLISFGVPLFRLQIDLVLTPYTPKFIDGVWFLLADPLPVIENNNENKRKLWEALKRIFL